METTPNEQNERSSHFAGFPSAEVALNGGKHYLASEIIKRFPPHIHYVEPYFGGGAVLFAKPAEWVENHSEVINDINLELTNFWYVLSDRDLFTEFSIRAALTPFSEVEWKKSKRLLGLGNQIDRALRFFTVYRQSRQGLGKDFATLSRNRTRRGMNEQVSSWLSAVEGLPEAHARLQSVVILDNSDALDVIRQQDGPNTLFYLDPPYLHSTRVTTSDYEHEMSEGDHAMLLKTLAGIQGKFILSGYHSPLYDDHARANRWRFHEFAIDNKASSKKTKETKIEILWMNFPSTL